MRDERRWERELSGLPRLIPHFNVDVHHTAFVLIDVQNSMASAHCGVGSYLLERYPDQARYFLGRVDQVVIPTVQTLLRFFRTHRLPVIYITVGPELPDGRDYFPLRRLRDEEIESDVGHRTAVFQKGTPEHAILEAVAPEPGDLVINKITRSPFTSTGLDQVLRHLDINSLVVAGVNTNVCVETTVRDAADRGYRCMVVADGCAAFDEVSHTMSLKAIAGIFGRVVTSDEALDELAKALD